MGFPYPYPLGLPKGTVRATLTIILSIDLVILSIDEQPIADDLSTLVAVALTFYFGGKMRANVPVPRSVIAAERAWGLPAGTIRFILFLIFGSGLYYITFVQGRESVPNYYLQILYIILGYTIGTSFLKIRSYFWPVRDDRIDLLDHLKALAAIFITATTVYFTQTEPNSDLTELWIFASSIILGFYFGSRDQKPPPTSDSSN